MNRPLRLWTLVALLAATICWLWERPLWNWLTKRDRAERRMLYLLKVGVFEYFQGGGSCPTNWLMLSNAMKSQSIVEFAKVNALREPSDLYTVLRTPYHHRVGTNTVLVFLVRSRAYHGGHWYLGKVDVGRATGMSGDEDAGVFLGTFATTELPREIREELEVQRAR